LSLAQITSKATGTKYSATLPGAHGLTALASRLQMPKCDPLHAYQLKTLNPYCFVQATLDDLHARCCAYEPIFFSQHHAFALNPYNAATKWELKLQDSLPCSRALPHSKNRYRF
jgi:hypothetical protein